MKAVFLGGSRRISRLNDLIRAKLDEIVRRDLWVFVGDANGADRAMQEHLAERGYQQVVVYSMTATPRNNVGHWQIRHVPAPPSARGFDFYALKDNQMAEDASFGLMLWDGKSRGTLANVQNLLTRGKPVAVYLSSTRRFISLRTCDDLMKIGVTQVTEPQQPRLALN